jgi:hypothetical protein
MRFASSVIVLPLILAVPFGLAIRDSLHGDDRAGTAAKAAAAAADRDATMHAELVAAEREQYERGERLAAERHAWLAALIGSEPATLGPALAHAQLGELASAADVTVPRNPAVQGSSTELARDGSVLEVALTIERASCRDLRETLVDAWGEAHPLDASSSVWIDPAHHRRASLLDRAGECTLSFDRIVGDAAWVAMVVPGVLRKTTAQATKLFGAQTRNADGDDSWHLAGPPAGAGSTELSAELSDAGTIDRTRISVTVSDEQAAALIDAISKQLGRQPVRDDASSYRWDHLLLSYEGHNFILGSAL